MTTEKAEPTQGDSSGSLNKCSDDCPGDETCEYTKVCMCGMPIDHSPWEGHSPVSMHDYYCSSPAETEPAQGDALTPAERCSTCGYWRAARLSHADDCPALSETKPAQEEENI